jgi:hypothetical protein
MDDYFFLVPLGIILGLGSFVGFWCLVVKMLSFAGWQRLAQYRIPRPLGWPSITLGRTKLGGISYKNVIKASAQAEGLALESMILFRIGHPPLLIPWSAIGPLHTEKSFWTTFHSTVIRTDNGGSVSLSFTDERFAAQMQSWLQIAG